MEELFEEYYTYKGKLTKIKSIYILVKTSRLWFKEYINAMTLKAGFKQCKTDTCLLYIVNELSNLIVMVYIDDTLEIEGKPSFTNTT